MSVVQSLLPIAIVGGGPAGLTLARVLQLRGVQCRVYENEAAASERDQGGSLDLHEDSGLAALQHCGLIDQFNRHSRPEADCLRIMDKTGRLLYCEQPPDAADAPSAGQMPSGRPEIDRLALRDLLLHSLQPDTVQWGRALSGLQSLPPAADGPTRWELSFKDGSREQATLVVGADGAWSRIRSLLSSARPRYTGITFVDFTVRQVAARHAAVAELVGPGTATLLDEQRGLLAQMNGNDTLRTYAALKVPESWADDEDGGAFLSSVSPEAIERLIARYFSGWHETALELMRRAELPSVAVRRIYALPADGGFTHSQHTRLLTALGDAAHVMSPFAGEGVNLAMIDAAQLALALSSVLCQSQPACSPSLLSEQLGAAIVECELRMFERSKAAADEAANNLELFFEEGAAASFARYMRRRMSGAADGGQHHTPDEAADAAQGVRDD